MKRILLISPCFHGYERLIISKLEEKGHEVFFFSERDYSLSYKITHHISWKLLQKRQTKHYKRILDKVQNISFDYLFVIRGFLMTKDFINTFKKHNPTAHTIMYQWDSNRTNNFSSLISCFDRVHSFDYEDCEKLKLNYLPLFYTDDVKTAKFNPKYTSDFFFMGTYLPERYRAIKLFNKKLSSRFIINSYIYIPFSSKLKELLNGNTLTDSFVHTQPLDRKKYLEMLKSTNVMVDVSNVNQTGLAMRIIEALAMGKKVITNNYRIKEEPFYDPHIIYIIDDKNPIIDSEFITNNDKQIEYKLSISEWLDRVLS